MASFKKKKYTDPVVGKHDNDISKDWYIFFRYKHDGKIYKFKRREGVNRIKVLEERLIAIDDLLYELKFDLKNGWNPIIDPKREKDYNPYIDKELITKAERKLPLIMKSQRKEAIFQKYLNK